MRQTGRFSRKAFKYALICLGFIILAIIIILLGVVDTLEIGTYIVGLAILIGCIFAIVGLIKSFQGIKEPATTKKILGLLINLVMSVLLVLVFVINFIDIYRAFN